MINSKEVEIYKNKSKSIFMVMGVVCFILAGIWLIFISKESSIKVVGVPILASVLGMISLLFGAICGIFAFKILLNKKPLLIISNSGITDNTGAFSIGYIPWEDIELIEELKVSNQRFINIILKDTHNYIDREKNSYIKKMLNINYKLYNSIVPISTNLLKYNYKELKFLIEDNFNNYKKNNNKE